MSDSESEPEFYLSDLEKDLLFEYNKFMLLKIFVDSSDNELKQKYEEIIYQHHLKLHKNIHHIDAGFDLLSPEPKKLTSTSVNKLDYKIICSAQIVGLNDSCYNTGFYMYPRSSISKSNIRLANNVGIIDAGYRGHLMGMFDSLMSNAIIRINKFERHLQICAPGLIPIMVTMVATKEELGEKTARGEGGFGSTGK
jgi:dUTP pyrophosphatase